MGLAAASEEEANGEEVIVGKEASAIGRGADWEEEAAFWGGAAGGEWAALGSADLDKAVLSGREAVGEATVLEGRAG